MKVFYVHEETSTILRLSWLSSLNDDAKVVVNYNNRDVEYNVDDIYNCKDWKAITIDENSLNIEDIQYLMSKLDKDDQVYNKLKMTESMLLNVWVEDMTEDFQLERSLY